jgi:hypothetical protein
MVTTGKIYQSKSNKVVLLTLSSSVDVNVIDFPVGLHKGISESIGGLIQQVKYISSRRGSLEDSRSLSS